MINLRRFQQNLYKFVSENSDKVANYVREFAADFDNWVIKGYRTFLKKASYVNAEEAYQMATEYSKEYRYAWDDLSEFLARRIKEIENKLRQIGERELEKLFELGKNDRLFGIYFSALLNCVIHPDTVFIFDGEIQFYPLGEGLVGNLNVGLGTHLPHGTLILLQDHLENIGYKMMGGTIVIMNNTAQPECFDVGHAMKDGIIVGRCDCDSVGEWMEGGEIRIAGKVWDIGKSMCGGEISVAGSVGRAGEYMSDGNIKIKGNVDDRVGWNMSGGTICIFGNVDNGKDWKIGFKLEGGKIIVKGNASTKAGVSMQGGQIYVEPFNPMWRPPGIPRGVIIRASNDNIIQEPAKMDLNYFPFKGELILSELGEVTQWLKENHPSQENDEDS